MQTIEEMIAAVQLKQEQYIQPLSDHSDTLELMVEYVEALRQQSLPSDIFKDSLFGLLTGVFVLGYEQAKKEE